MKNATGSNASVFLGGSCNPTTWRFDYAIPTLEEAGVSFYNPQVDDWSPELVAIEAAAKDEAKVLLFVIDGQTRAGVSIMEALKYGADGRTVVLSIENIPMGTVIENQEVLGRDLKDANRMRSYLSDLVKDYPNVYICDSMTSAVQKSIDLINS
ncbi:nucleoside 2-deoxyribosyltransferase domain-containing protein [Candidatus Uhrbacteria bacterium]|nr:nucleoside 2-deoxyribosyltransferase domain-containing protein [Candidatus Uhrbacteria bacterium]